MKSALTKGCNGAALPTVTPTQAAAAAVLCVRRRRPRLQVVASSASVPAPGSSGGSNGASQPSSNAADGISPLSAAAAGAPPLSAVPGASGGGLGGWLKAQQQKSADLRRRLASLGLAAVLAYGLFDAVTYTAFYTMSWLAYEARTGLNPTQNLADIAKIVVLMWAGNNVTRPFRLAGAAALAPFMDRVMEGMQARLRLKRKATAFTILVAAAAAICFSVVGFLFVSRWAQG